MCKIRLKFFIFLLSVSSCYGSQCLSSPPIQRNSRLVNSKITCDDGFELFQEDSTATEVELKCIDGKWKSPVYFCAANAALHKPTNQSTTKTVSHSNNGNDGQIDTCTQTSREVSPWWRVDLLNFYNVRTLRVIMGASDSSNNDLEIRVGNSSTPNRNPLCAWEPSGTETKVKLLKCARPLVGRYVSIQSTGEGSLSLCEVEIFSVEELPRTRCEPEAATGQIISFNGTCFEFAVQSGQTFEGARSQCISRGGDLPSENALIHPTLNLITSTLDKLKDKLKRPLVWIGVERDPGFTSRTWRWVSDGHVIKKPSWGKDQPNNYNGEQNCAVLDGGRDWAWNDVGCGLDYFHWICVFPPTICGSPDKPEGVDLEEMAVKDSKIGAVINYKCPNGHVMKGKPSRTCAKDGFWSGTPPTCKYVDCGKYDVNLTNGEITKPNRTDFGAAFKFKCDENYTLSGSSDVKCEESGWVGTKPTCLYSICPPPTPIINGTFITTGTTVNSKLIYSCNQDHILIGNSEKICLLGGKWGETPPPYCKFVECGDPPSVSNGMTKLLNGTTTLGSVATVHCDSGYYAEQEHSVCSPDGKWKGELQCQMTTCDEPEVPRASYVTGYDFTVGSVITYHCEEGHVLKGPIQRTCREDGEWSPSTIPECHFVDCGKAMPIKYGQLSYPNTSTYFNSTVVYSCALNYKLQGDRKRTCLANSQWSSSTPTCVETRCAAPTIQDNSYISVSSNDRHASRSYQTAADVLNTSYKIGTMIKYKCNRGFLLIGKDTASCVEGKWTDEAPTCEWVDCGSPKEVEHGSVRLVSNTTYLASVALYECDPGYYLNANARRVCNGTWTGVEPSCLPVKCTPPMDHDVHVTFEFNGLSVGSKLTYNCPKGYQMIGERTRSCTLDGSWDSLPPTCEMVVCPVPGNTENLRQFLVNSSTTYGSLLEYHCNPGFDLQGPQIQKCTESKIWTPSPPPTCIIKLNEPLTSNNLAIGLGVTFGLVFFLSLFVLLIFLKRSKETKTVSKQEPTVNYPVNNQQHYYDNPTADPIYENLDDYGSVVTINGVAIT
ncbi:unnamed protein product [Allacma fusca]|uniref:Sushi/von Willebrand factor type A/EGF/pentraxin domain-containing 1 n=1 Tax=Allacma fusca TaxID=39272 RepID=A0A8J2P809_9HEXA|nr:unnamed protein product [Allacma fusca]